MLFRSVSRHYLKADKVSIVTSEEIENYGTITEIQIVAHYSTREESAIEEDGTVDEIRIDQISISPEGEIIEDTPLENASVNNYVEDVKLELASLYGIDTDYIAVKVYMNQQ